MAATFDLYNSITDDGALSEIVLVASLEQLHHPRCWISRAR